MTSFLLMSAEEMEKCGVNSLREEQQKALHQWGMRMYSLGQHTVGNIEKIKYEGRLIILDDGSKWAVDSIDANTAEYWNYLDKVVVIDGVMYRIEDAEYVSVEEEDD